MTDNTQSQTVITWNNCSDHKEPDWSEFDGLELAGCKQDGDSVERVSSNETPDFYTLYGHMIEGGVEALHDFPGGFLDTVAILDAAEVLAKRLNFNVLNDTAPMFLATPKMKGLTMASIENIKQQLIKRTGRADNLCEALGISTKLLALKKGDSVQHNNVSGHFTGFSAVKMNQDSSLWLGAKMIPIGTNSRSSIEVDARTLIL